MRYIEKPFLKLQRSIRARIKEVMTREKMLKNSRTFTMLGYDPMELVHHIDKQLRLGMTWKNYGKVWHLDHIKPVSWFDLSKPSEIKKCWALENLQPRFATNKQSRAHGWDDEGNIEKGNRYAG